MGYRLMIRSELKKGSAEILILALLENRDRHGYEISKLIEQRSDGLLQFHVASLYPYALPFARPPVDPRALGGEAQATAPALLPADRPGTPGAGIPTV